MYSSIAPLLLFAVLLYLTHPFLTLLIRQCRSPLRLLPGPPSRSFLMGNLSEMHDMENTNLIHTWEEAYGSSWVYRGFFGGYRLITTDLRALGYVLAHAYDYPKPQFLKDQLATMGGGAEGLLNVEGEVHRRQRRILTPAFTASHIKSLAPIFFSKAEQLRDIWLHQLQGHPSIASSPSPNEEGADVSASYARGTGNRDDDDMDDGIEMENQDVRGERRGRVDVLAWLSRATLDVIGLAGFGYTFNALPPPAQGTSNGIDGSCPASPNELANAFGVIFRAAENFQVIAILRLWFPCLRRFERNNAVMTHARETMQRIGMELIEERRSEVVAEMQGAGNNGEKCERIDGDKTVLGRDLLSVLVRSSLATSAQSQQMSIKEILCQVSTLMAAGHETTSSALAWALYALAKCPVSQSRLRDALRTVPFPASSSIEEDALFESIHSLPYLDWVVRETLRLHSPATNTMRVCTKSADVIPTAGTWVGRDGVERSGIEVRKGDMLSVPIQAINRSKKIWGEDAWVFRPERWEHPPQESNAVPGLYSNILTFLNGNPINGNRACIGYKFALAEIKIFLFVLLRDMEFSIDPALVVEKKVGVVTRPFVKSEPQLGNQMPLNIRMVAPS